MNQVVTQKILVTNSEALLADVIQLQREAEHDHNTPSIQCLPQSINSMSVDDSPDILTPVNSSCLNADQCRAYEIIIHHLDVGLAGRTMALLRMIIHGEGGTGKSKVLQTVTAAFKQQRCEHILLKAAYTAVAASLIDGKTTHTIGSMTLTSGCELNKPVSDEGKTKLEKTWAPISWLMLDKMSMLAKDFFAVLSCNASIGKHCMGDASFGGINVVILGGHHQFPPVTRPICDALFYPSNSETDLVTSQIRQAIYEEFMTVVILKEQK